MFKFLKDKLKSAVSAFSKKVEEEAEEALPEEAEGGEDKGGAVEEPEVSAKAEKAGKPAVKAEEKKAALVKAERSDERKPTILSRIRERFVAKPREIVPEKAEAEKPEKEAVEKKGFAAAIKERITTKKISREKFHELFWELEVLLLENNVALEVIEKIKADLEGELVEKPLPRARVEEAVKSALGRSVRGLFVAAHVGLVANARKKKPFVILFVGINGSGKTTTIAKVARLLMGQKLKVVLAAADTFRAASIEQLQQHADKLGVKMIRQDYGSDPAAVAFDAIKYAEAHGIDAVLIDTAGRLHSNANLMDEMRKVVRVSKPDMKIFVGESITGNDCVNQAKAFNSAIGIDAIILAKADVDEKGGAAISVSYVTKKPILFLGTGQDYNDLREFEPGMVVEGLGL